MEGQVLVLQQNADGTETAVVNFSGRTLPKVTANSFKGAEASMNLVTKYLRVSEWQASQKAKQSFYGIIAGIDKMEIVNQTTGEVSKKDAVLINGFFSKDGSLPEDVTPQLFIIGQTQAVRTLKMLGKDAPVKITYDGAEQIGDKSINQFIINELEIVPND